MAPGTTEKVFMFSHTLKKLRLISEACFPASPPSPPTQMPTLVVRTAVVFSASVPHAVPTSTLHLPNSAHRNTTHPSRPISNKLSSASSPPDQLILYIFMAFSAGWLVSLYRNLFNDNNTEISLQKPFP